MLLVIFWSGIILLGRFRIENHQIVTKRLLRYGSSTVVIGKIEAKAKSPMRIGHVGLYVATNDLTSWVLTL
jgi:hypothetical protein